MTIEIKKITPVSEGELLSLDILISDGEHSEKITGSIASRMFLELGLPLSAGSGISISRESFVEIQRLMALTAAIEKGIELLAFAQNTKKGLTRKLLARGFSRELSDEAAGYLCEVGYIDENEQARLLSLDLAEKRLYGASRIRNELYKKGFCDDAIRAALEPVDGEDTIDFDEICAERIRKTLGIEPFCDRESRGKAMATLLRYGFSVDNVRRALETIRDKL